MNESIPKIIIVGNCVPSEHSAGNIYHPDGIAPTIMLNHGYPAFIVEDVPSAERAFSITAGQGNEEMNNMYITKNDSYYSPYKDMIQIPFNTAGKGLAYTITTRYGAMCINNLRDGNFPMTGILEIENPTEEMKQQIDNGTLNFDKGLPKEPKSCAVRGRDTENGTQQTLEVGGDVANALTTVQKDSMIFEPQSEEPSNPNDPTIMRIVPWNHPGGDVGDICPAITSSAFEHNNFVKEPGEVSVMADPRKNYGRIQPSSEASPTLLSSDYKSPHLVMENPAEIPIEIINVAVNLQQMASGSRGQEIGVTINPDFSLRPYKLNKAKDGISEFCTDYDDSISSTNIASRPNNVYGTTTRFRIRKLTPRECYRLMDVPENIIDRLLNSGISKSQHYKLAGNSIVVACLKHIFKSLFTNEIPTNQQLRLF